MNDNQNGYVTRSTSRVLSEPGGKCSFSLFGNGPSTTSNNKPKTITPIAADAKKLETTPTKTAATVSPTSVVSPQPVKSPQPETAMSAAARIKAKNEAQSFSLFGGAPQKKNTTSSNAFASSSSTNSYNVITDRSTSRVLAPPGGHSSIKLG